MYFEGKPKGLVLNKTNANTISDAYGDETEHWEGKEIVLYEAEVEQYQGLPDARHPPVHRANIAAEAAKVDRRSWPGR